MKGYFKDKKVAVKKVPLGELSENHSTIENALKKFDNPHLVKLLFAEEDTEFRYEILSQLQTVFSELGPLHLQVFCI